MCVVCSCMSVTSIKDNLQPSHPCTGGGIYRFNTLPPQPAIYTDLQPLAKEQEEWLWGAWWQ